MDQHDVTMVAVLLGIFAGIMSIGYLALAVIENKKNKKRYNVRRFVGLMCLLLGAVALVAWCYLLVDNWESFQRDVKPVWIHVVAELASALALLAAGNAMLRNRPQAPKIFVVANVIVLLTTLEALGLFAMGGHPTLMVGLAVVLTVAVNYSMGLVYAWEHFLLHLDRNELPNAPDKKGITPPAYDVRRHAHPHRSTTNRRNIS